MARVDDTAIATKQHQVVLLLNQHWDLIISICLRTSYIALQGLLNLRCGENVYLVLWPRPTPIKRIPGQNIRREAVAAMVAKVILQKVASV